METQNPDVRIDPDSGTDVEIGSTDVTRQDEETRKDNERKAKQNEERNAR